MTEHCLFFALSLIEHWSKRGKHDKTNEKQQQPIMIFCSSLGLQHFLFMYTCIYLFLNYIYGVYAQLIHFLTYWRTDPMAGLK